MRPTHERRDIMHSTHVEGSQGRQGCSPASIPTSFLQAMVAAAGARPQWEGALARNYLDDGPADRARALVGHGDPHGLLRHRLDLGRLPRTASALADLVGLVRGAGVSPKDALGFEHPGALFAARPTWAELFEQSYFGGFQPPLFGRPTDLARIAAQVEGGASVDEALDPVLASALLHELAHGRRDREALQPPYLDEAIVLWLTTQLRPGSAWPDRQGEHAVPGAPRLAEVGAAIAREAGAQALIRAHFGAAAWSTALLDALRAALADLGRARFAAAPAGHLLGEPHHPDPWLRLLAHAHAPTRPGPLPRVPTDRPAEPNDDDRAWVLGALRGLCVVATLHDGAMHLETRPPGQVEVDPTRGALRRARFADEIGFGPAEAWLPWRSIPHLRPGASLRITAIDELPAIAGRLVG